MVMESVPPAVHLERTGRRITFLLDDVEVGTTSNYIYNV